MESQLGLNGLLKTYTQLEQKVDRYAYIEQFFLMRRNRLYVLVLGIKAQGFGPPRWSYPSWEHP